MVIRARELNISALSAEEWDYLLGLFLTDGCRYSWKGKSGYRDCRVLFSLQGNEGEIVERITGVLKRLGLNPAVLKSPRGQNMMVVRVCSMALFDFLPDKSALRDNALSAEKLLAESNLYEVENGIPFLAGLLDGDGCCYVIVRREGVGHGRVDRWAWSFVQYRHPFLVDYMKRFIESLTSSHASVKVVSVPNGGVRACIRKSGVTALLNSGIAEHSWKVTRWSKRVADIENERMKRYNMGQVAKAFGVSVRCARNWAKAGKLKYLRRETRTEGVVTRPWYFVPALEVEKLKETLLKEEQERERIKSEGVRLIDAAKMLGVHEKTLSRWRRHGKLQATFM
jgi:hypothetical protein